MLESLLVPWVAVVMYCRSALAVLESAFKWVLSMSPADASMLPGVVCSELLALCSIAPLIHTDLRAQVAPHLLAIDASLLKGGIVYTRLPPSCRVRMLAAG